MFVNPNQSVITLLAVVTVGGILISGLLDLFRNFDTILAWVVTSINTFL